MRFTGPPTSTPGFSTIWHLKIKIGIKGHTPPLYSYPQPSSEARVADFIPHEKFVATSATFSESTTVTNHHKSIAESADNIALGQDGIKNFLSGNILLVSV